MIVTAIRGELINATQYRPAEVLELDDDQRRTSLLEAYCLDFEKDNPGESDQFTIADPDTSLLPVVDAIPQSERSVAAVQAAIWLARGVRASLIRERFEISDSEMLVAEKAIWFVRNR